MRFFLFILLFSSALYAQQQLRHYDLGTSSYPGKVDVRIYPSGEEFKSKTSFTNNNIWSETSFVAMWDFCHDKKFVPKLVDLKHQKLESTVTEEWTFKCIEGNDAEWLKLVKLNCENPQWELNELCAQLVSKYGLPFLKCEGRCEIPNRSEILTTR